MTADLTVSTCAERSNPSGQGIASRSHARTGDDAPSSPRSPRNSRSPVSVSPSSPALSGGRVPGSNSSCRSQAAATSSALPTPRAADRLSRCRRFSAASWANSLMSGNRDSSTFVKARRKARKVDTTSVALSGHRVSP